MTRQPSTKPALQLRYRTERLAATILAGMLANPEVHSRPVERLVPLAVRLATDLIREVSGIPADG